MFRRFSADFAVFSIFLDLLLAAASLHAAALLRPLLNSLPRIQDIPFTPVPWLLYLLFPLMWVGVLLLFSVYDGRRNFRVTDELTSLTLASILSAVAMAGVLYLSYRDVSRALFLFFVLLGYLLMVGWRLVIRVVFRYRWMRGVQSRRVLILGAGDLGKQMLEIIHKQPSLPMQVIGFLDDDPHKCSAREDVLGTLDDARRVIAAQQVDDVVLALPRAADGRLTQVVSELHDLPVRVWVMLDYYSLTLHRSQVEEFAGVPMLDLRAPALSEYQRILKRAFDILVILLVMPFALPILGLVSLAIWLDDRGPVFYHAQRMGENGRVFRMHKFRTMLVGAEKQLTSVQKVASNGDVLHKLPDDPRVTRVGRFLRRASLDELPQLFNVLKGQMSLVGPRPELPSLVENYDLWQRKRFAVPQGMTGWWQINGRSDRPMHLHTEDDLYYVQHYSLWLDLQILLKTVWVVLRGKGAY